MWRPPALTSLTRVLRISARADLYISLQLVGTTSKMNIRNFQSNNQNQTNQNQMPINFNAPGVSGRFNAMRNMPSRRAEFQGQPSQAQQWGGMPQLDQQRRQFNQGQQLDMEPSPMFLQDRFNNSLQQDMQRGPPAQLFQNQNNCMSVREPQFNQEHFNQEHFNQEHFNQEHFNRGPMDVHQSGDRQLNRSPDRGPRFQMNHSPERRPGFPHGSPNRSPERGREFNGRRLSRSPQRPMRGLRSRSRSPERSMRRGRSPLSPRRQRESPPYGRGQSPANGSNGGSWRPMVNLSSAEKLDLSRAEMDLNQLQNRGMQDMPAQEMPIVPRRKKLCGSRTKWYVRYITQGFSAEEALRMAQEPTQPAANYKPGRKAFVDKPRPSRGNRNEEYERKNKRPASRNSPERREVSINQNELKICLVPVGYPEIKLTYQEKLDLEEAILQEVVMAGSNGGVPLRFTNIHFKMGFVMVECSNQAAADWLLRTGSHLQSYQGCPVQPQLGKPGQQVIVTIFLPRSSGKSDEFLLGLLKSQNPYNTDLWRLTSRRDQGTGTVLTLGIDAASAADIAANDSLLFYRYGKVSVRGLSSKFGTKPPPKPSRDIGNRGPSSPPSSKPKQVKPKPSPVLKKSPKRRSYEGPVDAPEDAPLCIDLASDVEDCQQPLPEHFY